MMPILRGVSLALSAVTLALWLGCSPNEAGGQDGGSPASRDAGSNGLGDAGPAPTDGGGDAGDTPAPGDGGESSAADGGDPSGAGGDGGSGPDLCAGVSCSGLGACVVTDAVVEVDLASRCEDAYISGGAPATNHAENAQQLIVYSWPANTTANRVVMKCDLSDIPTGAVVEEARLQLCLHGFEAGGGDDEYEISARAVVNHDPVVSAVTWESYDGTNAWTGGANGGADDLAPATGAVVVDKTLGFKEWRLDDMVQDWVSDPAANYGFMLDGDATASADTNRAFRPREHSVETERPRLFVRYSLPGTPEASCQCDDGARREGLDCVLDDAGVMDDAGAPTDAGIVDDAGAPDSGPVVDPSADPCESAIGACFYVDQGHAQASDDNPGTRDLPWATPYRAAQQALSPGDVVVFRPGLYRIDHGGVWSRPAISPSASGTAEAPITFVAWPRHGAILDGSNPVDDTQALIGSANKDYVVIDGFIVQNTFAKGVLVFGADADRVRGVVIQNNIIRGVHHTHPTDNTDGIRLEDASGTIVRNNEIYDVHNGNDVYNAAGVKMYQTDGSILENNEIYDVGAGIYDKQAGVNNTFRRNYIHDAVRMGIQLYANDINAARGSRIYENVIDRCNMSLTLLTNSTAATFDDIAIYNNVFSRYSDSGMHPARDPAVGQADIYNNIFYREATPGRGDFYTYDDPPSTIGVMDYNLYAVAPTFVFGVYQTNRRIEGLTAWQGEGYGAHSLVGAPLFVDIDAGDFRLSAGSAALGAGRAGGTPAGAVVDVGAYPTGTGVIGVVP